ncbi:chemotaxis protein CheW [Parasporobacterium paucivorans]|uniref:Chemotaxis protein CheW n=1 Tax=Parasporobacterium paucivorans DSM 15970 TaxID=1122934 RepID=A0A1M6IAD4_9FIRM|nr:chemotaxis protein CheW [Parasporobacterium paucivorans]SHJ31414.1 purine-binding chemotaxis protein CheW [Parasporobacterium paucivorans DSM 15970]
MANNLENILSDRMETSEDTQKNRFLTFLVGNEGYGIEIQYITEIINVLAITKIPELPEYVKGIINLRGKIVPVMDVRLRFGKTAREYDDRTCIIVMNMGDLIIGLIVDSVSEVLTIPEEDISDPPQVGARGSVFIRKIGKSPGGMKLLLDCNRLLMEENTEDLSDEV